MHSGCVVAALLSSVLLVHSSIEFFNLIFSNQHIRVYRMGIYSEALIFVIYELCV